ncbi:armadillo-type protein [Mycena leptocephala]|nr:armadillo-type protein [Mycena leptocephala]
MPPLNTQHTPPSEHYWWWDSTTELWAPTTNLLLTAPLPFTTVTYCVQALALLWGHDGTPLSSITVNAYSTLLSNEYTSPFVKAEILTDLKKRAVSSEEDVREIVNNSILMFRVAELVRSGDMRLQQPACELLGHLGPSAMPVILDSCVQLASFLRDENPTFVVPALLALSWVVGGIDGAKAAVDAKVPDYLVELLQSPSSGVRNWSCQLIGRLVYHQSIALAILGVIPWERLVSFLSDAEIDVIDGAGYALGQVSSLLQGAQAVVDAKVQDYAIELLKSSSARVRKWACWLVGNLACHESTRPAILELEPYAPIVTSCVLIFISDDIEVVLDAIYALAEIAISTAGARAVVSANVLDHIVQVLGSPSAEVREWSCRLVGNLASHEAIAPAVFELKPCVRRLVSLLRDTHADVIVEAIHTLSATARWSVGAETATDAAVVDHIAELLQSQNIKIRNASCELVRNLASHESTASTLLMMKPAAQLVSFLWDEDHTVVSKVVHALAQVAAWPDGAQAAVNANVVDYLTELLRSPSVEVQKASCILIRELVYHDSIAPAILTMNPCVPLVSLLQNKDITVVKEALETLSQVAWWPDGAEAVVEAKAPDYLAELLGSPAAPVREFACYLVGDLADHNSTAPTIININPCVQLVSFLHDEEVDIVSAALYAFITKLLESPHKLVKRRTCGLVATLADHESTAPTILQLNLCIQLISHLQSTDVSTRFLAALGLARISEQTDGVPALANTTVFESLKMLRDGEDDKIEVQVCIILANLVCRKKENIDSGDPS